uniref:Uncharacterized protein n=1 Tax=Rhizophora mucronata TaxID=61149 RepID=A0A2P2NPS9_RHIMU
MLHGNCQLVVIDKGTMSFNLPKMEDSKKEHHRFNKMHCLKP